MTFADLINSYQKKLWLDIMVKQGGIKLSESERDLHEHRKNFYIMYEEDLSNMLCQTNTIITKN